MPAFRPNAADVELKEFDVLGQHGEPSFVRHVGLAYQAGSARRERVRVHQMGPPLQSDGEMRADVLATADLTHDELRKIRSFIDRHTSEHAARKLGTRSGYCIHPHVKPTVEADGTESCLRFSCVGFAVEAYRYAKIEPIDLAGIPLIGLEAVYKAYPDCVRLLQNEHIRTEMGLAGDGPWPVLLCGYFIHALNRPSPDIRQTKYRPVAENANFP